MQPLITGLNHLVDMRDQLGASFNSDELLEGIALKATLQNHTVRRGQSITEWNGVDDNVAFSKSFV